MLDLFNDICVKIQGHDLGFPKCKRIMEDVEIQSDRRSISDCSSIILEGSKIRKKSYVRQSHATAYVLNHWQIKKTGSWMR